MKSLFTLFTSLLITVAFSQQKLIAVKGPVTDAITTTLADAIALAQPDDKIYLPGGYFEYTGTINKKVHIIGTGFQDGQNITGKTTINNNLDLNDLASNSTFEGLYITGWFTQTNVNIASNYVIFKRCNMQGITTNFGSSYNNCSFINCVVRETLHFGEITSTFGINNTISNCFIGSIYRAQNSVVKNCIIGSKIYHSDNVTIKNSIYGSSNDCDLHFGSSNLILNNNFMSTNCVNAYGGGAIEETNTIAFNTTSEIFANATTFTFNSTYNYQLANTSLGQIGGTDGTDIGIFGGSNPWKVGSLPIIPNIEQNNSYLDVQNQTFKLNVKVVPQTH